MKITTIGSFPRSDKSIEVAIRDVVDLQIRNGVEVVTDGEQRADMITYFGQIPGFGRGSRGLRVVGKIKAMGEEGTFYKLVDHSVMRAYLKSIGKEGVKTKITLTGPVTLGMTAAMGGVTDYTGLRDPALYNDCADALIPIAEEALRAGALLQIDEPGLSARFESQKYTQRLLSQLPDSAIDDSRVSLHVCGHVGRIWEEIMGLDVNIFSFGFSRAQEAKNMETIGVAKLGEGKMLGVGFISNTYLEEPSVALRRLRSIVKTVGVERIAYIHPDCGFAQTPPELVEPILRNMKTASNEFLRSP